MSNMSFTRKAGFRLALLSGFVLLLLLVLIGLKYQNTTPDLEGLFSRMAKKEELLSRMRMNLIKSADIEKSAVMADTDEMSRILADQSIQIADIVERDRLELSTLIQPVHEEKEMQLLNEFNSCWADLRKIDKTLLQFAVENTNIKASTLSFTRGSKTIERFENSLNDIISSSLNTTQVLKLAFDALTAGLKIHTLHAPHIAAASDAEMNQIETEIEHSNQVVRGSLEKLQGLVSEENKASLREAISAYADFESVTAQVIKLSRQNTNIKSFELSMGRKRKVTTQCDEILASLQEIVQSRTFQATR